MTTAFAVLSLAAVSCHRSDTRTSGQAPAASSSAMPDYLTPELAGKVLAHVGDSTITLGDYAAVLDRMDRLERLRYQTSDRRKQLLDQMIDVELLAREAERRGLQNRPETKELVRQILRTEVLSELRDKLPRPEDLPASDVRAYYDAHRNDFKEPERRRIAHIVVADAATADRVIREAKAATPKEWGALVRKYSLDRPAVDMPSELAGDLGLVTPPSFGKSDNASVPEPVRAAAFEIPSVGQVLGHPVSDGAKFHVVRLVGKNDAHDRTFAEAARTIRVRLLQDRLHQAEAELDKELRARFPVQIDDRALAKVQAPAPGKKP